MAFCPCSEPAPSELMLIDEQGKPPGDDDHQIGYQRVAATVCDCCGAIEIERLDHDCFDFEEVWDQYEWYRLDGEDALALREWISVCDGPKNPSCRCKVHSALREQLANLPRTSWNVVFERTRHVRKLRFKNRKLSARLP